MTRPIFDALDDRLPSSLMNHDLPNLAVSRPFFVRDSMVCTYRMMHDPIRRTNRFESQDGGPWAPDNEVKYYVTGEEAFADMAAAMKTAESREHFIYLAGWFLDLDVKLAGTAAAPETCKTIFRAAAAKEVQIRALLWRNTLMTSAKERRPRDVYVIRTPMSLHTFELIVRPYVEHPPNSGVFVPDGPPTVKLPNFIVYKFKVDSNVVPFVFDGKREIPGVPGLQSGARCIPWNENECDFINRLASPVGAGHCAAILDDNTPLTGAHHQKVLFVSGRDGLIAFVGGVDINNDRFTDLHDVHCRVRGPAARRLLDVFNERWSFHPRREAVDKGMKHLGSSAPHPANMPRHHSRVQIARTYASGTRPRATPLDVTALLNPSAGMNELTSLLLKFDPFAGYPFAPSGKTETWEMVETAIARAKRFIYIENQYLTSIPLAQRLAAALPRLHHLTILITAWSDMDSDAAVSRTRQCLQVLRAADSTGKKLRVFTRTRGTRAYVHAKVFIFDDEFAIVASANGARRSFNCDSEASVGIFDVSHGDEVNLCFARRLRMRLWAEHLKIANEPDLWAIADGVGGVALWDDARGTTQSSRLDIWEYEKFIADYDARAKADPKTTPPRGQPSPQWEWDAIRDPFAPGPR